MDAPGGFPGVLFAILVLATIVVETYTRRGGRVHPILRGVLLLSAIIVGLLLARNLGAS